MTATATFTIKDADVALFLSDAALAHGAQGITQAEAWTLLKGKLCIQLQDWKNEGRRKREAAAVTAAQVAADAVTITVV